MPVSLRGDKSPNLVLLPLLQGGATVEQVGPVPRSDTLVEMLSRLSRRLVITHSLDNDSVDRTHHDCDSFQLPVLERARESPVYE